MKINFIKSNNSSKLSLDNSEVIILTTEDIKKTNSLEIKHAKQNSNFEGKFGQSKILAKQEKLVLLIGIGDEKKINDLILQKIGGKIASMLDSLKIKDAKIILKTLLILLLDLCYKAIVLINILKTEKKINN